MKRFWLAGFVCASSAWSVSVPAAAPPAPASAAAQSTDALDARMRCFADANPAHFARARFARASSPFGKLVIDVAARHAGLLVHA